MAYLIAPSLAKELRTSWALYVETRDLFRKLTEIQRIHIPEWFLANKKPVIRNGEVTSVYRHHSAKGVLANLYARTN